MAKLPHKVQGVEITDKLIASVHAVVFQGGYHFSYRRVGKITGWNNQGVFVKFTVASYEGDTRYGAPILVKPEFLSWPSAVKTEFTVEDLIN